MRKILTTLVFTAYALLQSACSSTPQYQCPSKDDTLRAGIYIYGGLKGLRQWEKDEISIARLKYTFACASYFHDDERGHIDEHAREALEAACRFFDLPPEEREIIFAREKLVKGGKKSINDFPRFIDLDKK